MRRLSLFSAAVLLLAACGPQLAGEQERSAVVLALRDELYMPSYLALSQAAKDLDADLRTFCASGGEVPLDAWDGAAQRWIQTSAFRFGPAENMRLESTIDYPIDRAKVEAAAETVSSSGEVASLGSDSRGLTAIELVLTRPDAENSCPYLLGASDVIAKGANSISSEWVASYGSELVDGMTSQEGVELAVNGIIRTLDDLVFFRLAGGSSGEDLIRPERVPEVAAIEVASIEEVYRGSEGGGISALVARASSSTDAEIRRLIDDLAASLPDDLVAAGEHATELRRIFNSEVTSLLAVTALLGDSDGDS